MQSASITASDAPASRRLRASGVAHVLRDVAPRVASVLPGIIARGPTHDDDGRPLLYLTFDDGPAPGITPRVAATLARFGAVGTFFLVGSRARASPGLVVDLVAGGHGVGNHGWAHVDAWKDAGATADLKRGEVWLEDALGRRVRDVRPPYGRLTPLSYRWARAGGRRVVLWDCLTADFLVSESIHQIVNRFARRVRPGSIVVLHDGRADSRAAAVLDLAMPPLLDTGWRFATL